MFSLLRTSRAASARRAFSTSPIARHDFAKISILGRLASEPEIASTGAGRELVRYVVAVTGGKDKATGEEKPVAFYRVASFDPPGSKRDFLMSVPKGSLVFVEGEATQRAYETDDGLKHTNFGVIQRSFTSIITKGYDSSAKHREKELPVLED